MENTEENSEKIGKIWKKIVKWYGNYRRKVSWIVKRYGNYGRYVSWNVKWYGKYGRKEYTCNSFQFSKYMFICFILLYYN
jgi:hypothetical protein